MKKMSLKLFLEKESKKEQKLSCTDNSCYMFMKSSTTFSSR